LTEPKIKVALLTGGDSSERAVCFMSAKAMANALPRDRYAVTIFDVSFPATRAADPALGENVLGKKPQHALVSVDWNHLVTTLYTTGFDVALLALHGGWGEDGTIQSLLEVAGIPYTGSAQHACTVAMDKRTTKALVSTLGVPSPQGKVLWSVEELDTSAPDSFFFHAPCVVKPNGGGSSVGVSIFAQTPDQSTLRQAVQNSLADGNGVLIEEFIQGQEITACVWGEGAAARALPLIEIVPQQGAAFYDYKAKYSPGGSAHLMPPRLAETVQQQIAEYALLAHRALGCRGVARSDYMVTAEGKIYFLELNTLPGMTETSLVPDAARASGSGFETLVENLVRDALQRGTTSPTFSG
jgi:D-alanine-D-alanine ligase